MKKQKQAKKRNTSKISYIKKPQGLSLEKWQILLRQQIAKEQKFKIKNIGDYPVYSDFSVKNPVTDKTYRVSIGGEDLGMSYCSCPDFKVNTLGTCKHVESVLNKLRRQKGGRKDLREGIQLDYSVVTLRYGLQRRVAFVLAKDSSEALKSLVSNYFDTDLFLTEKGFGNFDKFVKKTNELEDHIRYHDDALELIAHVRDDGLRKKRIGKMFPQDIRGAQWKTLLKTNLYSYQREGVLFAASAGRCLIADEMGLGKTIQAIAASEVMAKCFGIEKVLIICPASLKFQWKREIERFTKRDAEIIQGPLKQRHRQYAGEAFFKIVNYDVIHRDLDVISEWVPDLIILDEAQRIKNWKTRMAQSVKQLKSTYAIVLTGTPLENRLEELHSIVSFIDHHHLGPLFRFLDRHQQVDDGGKVVGYKDLHNLGRSLESIMVRRRSSEVLKQLPERIDKNYFVPMTKEQKDLHEDYRSTVARIVNKWQRYHFLTEQERQIMLNCLQKMRMVCDNTYLLDQSMIHGNKVKELEIQLEEIFEDPDAKVVIFSQWLRMMELVTAMLDVNDWKHVFLNGSVPSHKRGDLIKTFHDDPSCRIFLSTEAGSTGLNLQNANVIINMDLPWNPAVLEQRISRVHRMGQTQPVRVINFIAQGGIEHGMLGLLKFKQSMFSGVLDKGDNNVFMGESRFNRFMKTVEGTTDILKSEDGETGQAVEEMRKEQAESREDVGERSTKERDEITTLSQDKLRILSEQSGSNGLQHENNEVKENQSQAVKEFLRMGASFLNKISDCLSEEQGEEGERAVQMESSLGIRFHKDKNTGKKTIQIPLPEDETLEQVSHVIKSLLSVLKK